MRRLSLLFMPMLLLMGCVNLDVPKQGKQQFAFENKWQRQAALKEISRWKIRGALSVQQPGESEIANYNWQQRGRRNYRIELASSLNLYQIVITGNQGRVVLRRGKQPPLKASSPERLLQKSVGWVLPVSNLYYWVRGLPAPGQHQARYDRYGHLSTLAQSGWRIRYRSYTNLGRQDLPRKMELQRGRLKVTFVVKSWKLG